jgi:hypothetical protein
VEEDGFDDERLLLVAKTDHHHGTHFVKALKNQAFGCNGNTNLRFSF